MLWGGNEMGREFGVTKAWRLMRLCLRRLRRLHGMIEHISLNCGDIFCDILHRLLE